MCPFTSLFNIYSEKIFQEALEGFPEGIKINGETINNIRNANDTVTLASSLEDLQTLLEKINATSVKYGLNLNTSKTQYMTISKNASSTDQSVEVRCRIEKARTVFNKIKTCFVSRNLSLKLKIKMVRCYILPVLLYSVEAWTMTEALMRRLESFKMWIYRRILRISWIEHTTKRKYSEEWIKQKK